MTAVDGRGLGWETALGGPLLLLGIVVWLGQALQLELGRVGPRRWRTLAEAGRGRRRTLLAWGALLAAMNCCLYLAIERLPLGTIWSTVADLPIRFAGDTGTASRQERRDAAGADR